MRQDAVENAIERADHGHRLPDHSRIAEIKLGGTPRPTVAIEDDADVDPAWFNPRCQLAPEPQVSFDLSMVLGVLGDPNRNVLV
jgi:hypothetical protein